MSFFTACGVIEAGIDQEFSGLQTLVLEEVKYLQYGIYSALFVFFVLSTKSSTKTCSSASMLVRSNEGEFARFLEVEVSFELIRRVSVGMYAKRMRSGNRALLGVNQGTRQYWYCGILDFSNIA